MNRNNNTSSPTQRLCVYIRIAAFEESKYFKLLKRQLKVCCAKSVRNRFSQCQLVRVCADYDSGLRRDRSGLQTILEEARQGQFNVLVVRSLPTLSRDTIYALELLDLLASMRIRLIAVEEGFDSGNEWSGRIDEVLSVLQTAFTADSPADKRLH